MISHYTLKSHPLSSASIWHIFALWLGLPPCLVGRFMLVISRAHVTTMAIVIRLRNVILATHRVRSITAALICDLVVIILVLIDK